MGGATLYSVPFVAAAVDGCGVGQHSAAVTAEHCGVNQPPDNNTYAGMCGCVNDQLNRVQPQGVSFGCSGNHPTRIHPPFPRLPGAVWLKRAVPFYKARLNFSPKALGNSNMTGCEPKSMCHSTQHT